jgi:hypothetical protein
MLKLGDCPLEVMIDPTINREEAQVLPQGSHLNTVKRAGRRGPNPMQKAFGGGNGPSRELQERGAPGEAPPCIQHLPFGSLGRHGVPFRSSLPNAG